MDQVHELEPRRKLPPCPGSPQRTLSTAKWLCTDHTEPDHKLGLAMERLTVGQWASVAISAPNEAWNYVANMVIRIVRLRGRRRPPKDELIQEVMLRCIQTSDHLLLRKDSDRQIGAVIHRVVSNVALEILRSENTRASNLPCARDHSILEETSRSGERPLIRDAQNALAVRVATAIRSLPPPYMEISTLKLVVGWSKCRLVEFLKRWRPIRDDEACRLIKQSTLMLRAAVTGGEAVELWPRRYNRKVNRWYDTPPPSLKPHIPW